MQNKKIILEEIHRISEIMGVKPKLLIMEQGSQVFTKGPKYLEKLFESFGFKGNLAKATEKNTDEILSKFDEIFSKSGKKPNAEVTDAISLALDKKNINPNTGTKFAQPGERLKYVFDTMEKHLDSIDESLSNAARDAEKQIDKMYIEISSTPAGSNLETVYKSMVENPANRQVDSKYIIDYLKTEPEFIDIPEWYWKRLGSPNRVIRDTTPGTTTPRTVKSVEESFGKASEKVQYSKTSWKETWENSFRTNPDISLDTRLQGTDVGEMLRNTPLFRRASPEKQNEIIQYMVSSINSYAKTSYSKSGVDSGYDNLISAFEKESGTLTPKQQKNLIQFAINEAGVTYPWLPNPFAKGGIENIKRQLTFLDRKGQNIFGMSRYSKILTTPTPDKFMTQEISAKIFAEQLFKVSVKYWVTNALFCLGAGMIEYMAENDDPNLDPNEISEQFLIDLIERGDLLDWGIKASIPLPIGWSIAIKNVILNNIEDARKGFRTNDRNASIDEILQSDEFRFDRKGLGAGNFKSMPPDQSPDFDPSENLKVLEKRGIKYIEGTPNGLNYGMWYYSEEEEKAKLFKSPTKNKAPEGGGSSTTTTTTINPATVDEWKTWYKSKYGKDDAFVNQMTITVDANNNKKIIASKGNKTINFIKTGEGNFTKE